MVIFTSGQVDACPWARTGTLQRLHVFLPAGRDDVSGPTATTAWANTAGENPAATATASPRQMTEE